MRDKFAGEVDGRVVVAGYMAAVEGPPAHPLRSLKGTDFLKTTELIRKVKQVISPWLRAKKIVPLV